MNKAEKKLIAVIYDKQTGRIVLSHRVVLFDKSQEISREVLAAEAERLATEGKLPLPTEWGSVLLEMTKDEIETLIAINPVTQQPKFWDIRPQGSSEKK